MPTPRPIISASSEEKSTMSTRWLPSPITPRPAPRPNSAVTIGRPIASSEPKLSSSTTMAAMSPTPVAKPILVCWACLIACPPSSTCRVGERIVSAVLIHAVDRRLRQFIGPLVEFDGRESNRAGLRDCVRAGLIGAQDAGDVGETGDAHEHRRDRGAGRGVGELAGPRLEDDLVGVAGLGREAALK